LVGNLLSMVQVQSGSLVAQREWQPIEEVVGIALLRLDERLSGFEVIVDIPASMPLVPMDGLLIEQVLINLLENSAKYAPPRSRITIEGRAELAEVIVSVADQGPGIPVAERERVFEKFYRLGTNQGAGIGLGLPRYHRGPPRQNLG
jgi:two-component system sensor histidine kinase KdpD